ncbi:MAG: hypothetical protein RIA69_14370 [Cyclobacteriaceae bacterium]
MKNLQKNWNRIGFGLVLSALVLIVSCTEDETMETVYAEPTIEIISPTDLSNLEALVASPISFTIKVDAEAGLSSVSLNGNNIKTYSQGELTDTFEHEYVPGENGTITLDFVVEDAQGTSSANLSLNLEAVGDFGFLLADFGGDPGSSTTLSTIDPDHWDGTRAITTFAVNGNLTSSATYENVGSQFTMTTGATNPDPEAPLVYSGKTMKVVKNPAEWGTAGWSHIMFDFGTLMDQATVEALPQLNAEQTGLTAGTKFVEIDVFYEDTEAVPFASMVGDDVVIGDNPAFGSDKTKGYSFFLMLTKHEDHRLNPDGAGMYIGYEEYITEANTWITLRFDELYLESVGNFFGSGNENAATSDVIDGVKIVAGGGYGDGQSENAIYFRNLRIVDAD